jgi:hypothetical protein
MPGAHRLPGRHDGCADQHVGQAGKVIGQPFNGQLAFQILRQQAQQLGMMQLAQHIHLALGVAGNRIQLPLAFGRECGPVWRRPQGLIIQQLIQQQGMPGQITGCPFTGGHHPDHPLQGLRIFGQ